MMAFAAALEPLRAANRLSGSTLYGWSFYSRDGRPVIASNGVEVAVHGAVGADAKLDLLLVCAGTQETQPPSVTKWLRALARTGTALGGISLGAYALADAGLLDGRRCAVHWENLAAFTDRYPRAKTMPDILAIDGDRYTCSGGTSALDLMLQLVTDQHGRTLANGVSEQFIHPRIRSMQDNADKVLALHDEDQKLLTEWYAVQKANTAYSTALEEFRAASIARNRDQAPNIKRQTELVQRMTALLDQCPPGQKKAGCENADRDRGVIGKELRELNEAGKGAGDIMAIHARMEAAEKALPGYDRFNTRRTTVRADIDRAERAAREDRAQISRSYPDYVALSEPRPLSASAVQALLKDDEALVAVLVGSTKSFVWALTRERAEWAEIDAGSAALAGHVAVLRNGLDPLAQQDAEGSAGSKAGVVQGFDLTRAHALYKLVFGPVAPVLAGKRHLIVVPTGPLTSIPFQVLITAPPGPQTGADALRDAAWLIKSHALSVLPSVQSLNALRKLVPRGTATKPFFGVGDPVLDGPAGPRQRGAQPSSSMPARFYRNGLADIRAVRELTPLPDTADELRAIGKVLGATPDAINLREAASEARVKAAPLKDYRVIQFATHGLVAGDLSGLAEPALVLTPPPVATDADDGLLTASEIAALSLNADWVVLSACNTAAGASEGAEALSGLARAFFYAGARALLVSHWAVYSQAATELTTTTFAALAANPKVGRGQAFRSAMLALIAKGEPPSYWAPFVIVGEAGSTAQ